MLIKIYSVHNCVVTLWTPFKAAHPTPETAILRNAALAVRHRPFCLFFVKPLKSLSFLPMFCHCPSMPLLSMFCSLMRSFQSRREDTTKKGHHSEGIPLPSENITHTLWFSNSKPKDLKIGSLLFSSNHRSESRVILIHVTHTWKCISGLVYAVGLSPILGVRGVLFSLCDQILQLITFSLWVYIFRKVFYNPTQ